MSTQKKMREEMQPVNEVICIETDQHFKNISGANDWLGVKRYGGQCINSVLRGEQKTAYGYHGCRASDSLNYIELHEKYYKKPPCFYNQSQDIYCIELCKTFHTQSEVQKYFKETLHINRIAIADCLHKVQKHSHGYHFCYLCDKDSFVIDIGKAGKAVRCVKTGVVYKSLGAATRATGASADNIKKVIKGQYKQSGGYTGAGA